MQAFLRSFGGGGRGTTPNATTPTTPSNSNSGGGGGGTTAPESPTIAARLGTPTTLNNYVESWMATSPDPHQSLPEISIGGLGGLLDEMDIMFSSGGIEPKQKEERSVSESGKDKVESGAVDEEVPVDRPKDPVPPTASTTSDVEVPTFTTQLTPLEPTTPKSSTTKLSKRRSIVGLGGSGITMSDLFVFTMRDGMMYAALKEFAASEHCPENLLFLESLARLQAMIKEPSNLSPSPSNPVHTCLALAKFAADAKELDPPQPIIVPIPSTLLARARSLRDDYLAEAESPMEVNVPSTLRKEVDRDLLSSEIPPLSNVFDRVADEVLSMVYRDIFPRFLRQNKARKEAIEAMALMNVGGATPLPPPTVSIVTSSSSNTNVPPPPIPPIPPSQQQPSPYLRPQSAPSTPRRANSLRKPPGPDTAAPVSILKNARPHSTISRSGTPDILRVQQQATTGTTTTGTAESPSRTTSPSPSMRSLSTGAAGSEFASDSRSQTPAPTSSETSSSLHERRWSSSATTARRVSSINTTNMQQSEFSSGVTSAPFSSLVGRSSGSNNNYNTPPALPPKPRKHHSASALYPDESSSQIKQSFSSSSSSPPPPSTPTRPLGKHMYPQPPPIPMSSDETATTVTEQLGSGANGIKITRSKSLSSKPAAADSGNANTSTLSTAMYFPRKSRAKSPSVMDEFVPASGVPAPDSPVLIVPPPIIAPVPSMPYHVAAILATKAKSPVPGSPTATNGMNGIGSSSSGRKSLHLTMNATDSSTSTGTGGSSGLGSATVAAALAPAVLESWGTWQDPHAAASQEQLDAQEKGAVLLPRNSAAHDEERGRSQNGVTRKRSRSMTRFLGLTK